MPVTGLNVRALGGGGVTFTGDRVDRAGQSYLRYFGFSPAITPAATVVFAFTIPQAADFPALGLPITVRSAGDTWST